MHRIFLLSPAHSSGERAKLLLNPRAQFDLARRLRLKSVSLGEVFSFLSDLYFRGKLTYATTFAQPPENVSGALVITSNRGLLDASTQIDLKLLQSFSEVPIDVKEERYRRPLLRKAKRIRQQMGDACEVVLLGSIATGKYVELLLEVFDERLVFPVEFVGRGNMSRGGLMLHCATSQTELQYVSVLGATRRGRRAAKLIDM